MDPEEWKQYFLHKTGDIGDWKSEILNNVPKYQPFRSMHKVADSVSSKVSTISGKVGGSLSEAYAASGLYICISLFYVLILFFRVLKARRKAKVSSGNGLLELVISTESTEGQSLNSLKQAIGI